MFDRIMYAAMIFLSVMGCVAAFEMHATACSMHIWAADRAHWSRDSLSYRYCSAVAHLSFVP